MYIANPGRQDFAFTYKLAEQKGAAHHKVDIPAGGQVRLANLSSEDTKSIADHYASYGMMNIKAVKNAKAHVGLVWSDSEIKWDWIAEAVSHNTDVLTEVGSKLRDAAAVAADQSLLSTAPQGSELKSTSVQVIEHETANKDQEINEERKVVPDKDANPSDRRGKQKVRG